MKHLIISREYPPAPGGGIGTYVHNISRLLAEAGETVHVISQKWEGAEADTEELFDGKLIIHRIAYMYWGSETGQITPHPDIISDPDYKLFNSDFHHQYFSMQVAKLAEKLVYEEGINIIESQEYEAPLYYFLLRRACGLGPKSNPPCVIHLHTPTEFIMKHNQSSIEYSYFHIEKRQENFCIASADSLLCPSYFLARQAENLYGFGKDTINTIHLPRGDIKPIKRSDTVWDNGSVCFLGRLEKRKGILEFVDSAVSNLDGYPKIKFIIIGGDVIEPDGSSVLDQIKSRIPQKYINNFEFTGHLSRSDINKILKKCKISVIPSRFENFPYTCIESMLSGIPVVATKNGGMAEMITDCVNGWLSEDESLANLSRTLKDALDTSSDKLEEMGLDAYKSISSLCDNDAIVQQHIDYKSKLVNDVKVKSAHFTDYLPFANKAINVKEKKNKVKEQTSKGTVVVITGDNDKNNIKALIDELFYQKNKPASILVAAKDINFKDEFNQIYKDEKVFVEVKGNINILQFSLDFIEKLKIHPLGLCFVDSKFLYDENYLSDCEAALENNPDTGIASTWFSYEYQDNTEPKLSDNQCQPILPYQLFKNEIADFSLVRYEALKGIDYNKLDLRNNLTKTDIFNLILLNGWSAINIPLNLAKSKEKYDVHSPLLNSSLPQLDKSGLKEYLDAYYDEIANILLSNNYILDELSNTKIWLTKLSKDRQNWIESQQSQIDEQNNKIDELNNRLNEYIYISPKKLLEVNCKFVVSAVKKLYGYLPF